MEVNKFDKNIKERIEARMIVPSTDAWEKLEAMLPVAQKPKRRLTWWYVAASFVGVALVSSVFFNQIAPIEVAVGDSIVVEQDVVYHVTDVVSDPKDETEMVKKQHTTVASTNNLIKIDKRSSQSQIKKNDIVANAIIESVPKVIALDTKPSTASSRKSYISGEKLLAEVLDLNSNDYNVEKPYEIGKTGITTDPNTLLSTVEVELNQSFKESTLQKVNKKINVVRTAFVNRNYQE
ncbi:hypothetical protein FFWV33_01170 [Flavobacterium faecale]|uniref:Uncharacterized protein n=1 Tax=Flavobacterium faecale TaxID=1355330 RepID=A0A2S1L927_9FLAO|nr:hypothetical protein [Flavobacterium faecale]AWG20233.1 hypothetical protein FFWV33_01170 [Flavobacterium faecale]